MSVFVYQLLPEYWLLAGLTLMVLASGCVFHKQIHPRSRWAASGLTVLIALGAVFFAENAANLAGDRTRSVLTAMAPTFAAEMVEAGHNQLSLETPPDDPVYLRCIEAERRWLRANPQIADVYTMAVDENGQLRFLVDSETDYNRDGDYDDSSEQRTEIGEPVDDGNGLLANVQQAGIYIDEEPFTDRWGTWVSVTAPIRDPETGRITALLGVDYDATEFLAAQFNSRIAVVLVAGVAQILVMIAFWWMSRLHAEINRRKLVEQQLEAARQRDRGKLTELEREIDNRTRELREAATHDKLTGLPNRRLLAEKLDHAVQRALSDDSFRFAFLFIDFDRFKIVNDSLGHHVGDMLLKSITDRIKSLFRAHGFESNPQNIIARWGGDEFCILLVDVGEAEATRFAEQLIVACDRPHQLEGHDIHSTLSIGITLSRFKYADAQAVIRDADNAMYRAKFEGKGRAVLFDNDMFREAVQRMQLENDLRMAIGRNQLRLCFQPIFDLRAQRVVSGEALVRWDHHTAGPVPPGIFIPLAEETGMIREIGPWVFRAAAMASVELESLADPDEPTPTISINVSQKQLIPGLTEQIRAILTETGAKPQNIIVEITESALVADDGVARKLLDELRAIGLKVYLDDFGIGYSALGSLSNFPLDGIKLDRSFIGDAMGRRERIALIHAILMLARDLNLITVVEGVETSDQLALLLALECDRAQGFFLSTPRTKEDFFELVSGGLVSVQREPVRSAA